ncbi:MAG TPA: RDD family protein [Planctomycetaceae bacterium]
MIAPAAPAPPFASPADPPPVVDLGLRIETPENVVLTFTLAGPTLRAGAYLIDLALRLIVMTGVLVVVTCAAFFTPGAATGVLLLVWFALEWGYFTLFEAFWNGRTPGKWALGLRVVQDRGYPITFWASAGRNLLRFADGLPWLLVKFFPMYAAGFAAMLLSPRFKRLGDLLARTVVVCERGVVLPREPVILERIDPLPREEVPGPPPPPRTLTLIDQFLGRRHAVSIPRGHEIARPLARSLARRLRYAGDPSLVEKYPMAFLARVYVTFLRRDEEDESDRADRSPPLARDRHYAREGTRA